MFGRSAGVLTLTACALSASAFLIPAGVAPVSDDVASALTLTPGALSNAKHVALTLPCSECVFSSKQQQEEKVESVEDGDALFWIQGGANSVLVNFTVSEDGKRLEVNGETIYPLGIQTIQEMMTEHIYVDQVPASASLEDIKDGKVKSTSVKVTGSGIMVMSEETVSQEGDKLVSIQHGILEIENQPVSLDLVIVNLLKTESGELFIMNVKSEERPFRRPQHESPSEVNDEGMPFHPHHGNKDMPFGPFRPHHGGHPAMGGPPHRGHGHMGPPGHPHKECKVLPASLCKLRNMIHDKVMGMRKGGCHGRKHGGQRPHRPVGPHFIRPGREDMRPHHQGRPHHMRPHGGHHGHDHHGHGHHFGHSFTHGLASVIIPTMAGVAVGMAVSVVGLLVGRLICFLWIKFYRGGRRGGYRRVRLEESTDDEKVLVVEELSESEPLPVYEQAPAYEENEKEVK